MRPRATFYSDSDASRREMPVQAPAGPQRRNPCSGYQRRLLLGAADPGGGGFAGTSPF